jgi:four helix bundle protein
MMKKLFALELAIEFCELTRSLRMPQHLKEQFERAVSSIALNLSEGSAKPTVRDRRKYYYIALGSFRESETILRLTGAKPEVVGKANFLGACLYRLCKALS